ncbi:amino acid ABC transporter ATP-binding protein, PAAT family [Marininema mesophilum]|uniref:Amino acid ABC transporter ATP-binding protein, PAAT family n=1 Tax=Marininema mesophilum TaxID=1048340 RepID=A0A1H2VAD7_9BACL|nr:ectoine/hydroxyectoine ABC transporter ATP-binding protein EhuA [Marininema mesophilum]SDW64849.1 amino acid ABC transporter ATP-binding protein, PAAT family [Marininema mesophilum]
MSGSEVIERPDTEAPIEGKEPIVRFEKISKSFGELDVLKEVDLDLYPGERVAIIGPSGSGKTTMARLLMTLEEPTDGYIEVDGRQLWHKEVNGELVKANEKHLHEVRGDIGMVFQHFHLFPHMTVLKNLMEAPIKVKGQTKAKAREEALAMLEKVGMVDFADQYPARLSGGQQQRVAIARALVMHPKVMLFDEPTSALDPETVGEVLEVIKEIAKDREMAMMLITHEMSFARDIADRIAFFDEGKIQEQGPPAKLLNNPETERLGEFLNRFGIDGNHG